MKVNDNEIIVTVPWDELCGFHSVDSNRCGYLTWEEAKTNGFSQADWDRFQQRSRKLMKTIHTNGFSNASIFTLAKDENGVPHILDGQGRRMALWLLAQEHGLDLSKMEFKCRLFTNPMSIKDMSVLIKEMNTNSTNWQTKDLRRSDAIASDDPSVMEAHMASKALQEALGISDCAANLLLFGTKATHQRSSGQMFSTADYVQHKDLFIDIYTKILKALDYIPNQNGPGQVLRPKAIRTIIRKTNFLIALIGCLRDIIKYHPNVEDAIPDLYHFAEKVIKAASGDNAYIEVFMKMGKEKSALKEKVRKHCKKASIRAALFKTN